MKASTEGFAVRCTKRVPELTCSVGINLNKRVQLRRASNARAINRPFQRANPLGGGWSRTLRMRWSVTSP
jgi:hypothetical protein